MDDPKPEPEFTPSPWRVTRTRYELSDTFHYGIAAGARYGPFANKGNFHSDDAEYYTDEINVVEIASDRDYNTPDGGIMRKEDAYLIAAAPDLYAACKLALKAFENNWAIDWGVLAAAISKAEGKKQ